MASNTEIYKTLATAMQCNDVTVIKAVVQTAMDGIEFEPKRTEWPNVTPQVKRHFFKGLIKWFIAFCVISAFVAAISS